MKSNILILFFLLIISPAFYAQTYIEDTDTDIIKKGEDINPYLLSNMGMFTVTNQFLNQSSGNSVFLEQIGEMNKVNIITRTEASEINVRQEGNNNNTSLKYFAKTAYTDVFQLGNYNTIKDFVNAPTEEISLELQQTGNDQIFERNGINELTKSIKFNQTEATPVLIINSYN